VPLDLQALERALRLPQVSAFDAAHAAEHSLEVHLPFFQELLGEFSLAPFVVGDATPGEVDEVLELLWGGPETLIVVSSDLSHYHDYATAREMDAETSRAIVALDPQAIDYEQACGRIPVQGLLLAARRHGLTACAVDVRNSGDTAGPRDAVVGYGAYVFA
jgi:AmmeMemoRadiSam system protein B